MQCSGEWIFECPSLQHAYRSIVHCSGERKVTDAGQALGASWDTGFEPVAIKAVWRGISAQHELQILQRVQRALQGKPAPHHVTQLLDSFHGVDKESGHDTLNLVTRCRLH